VEHAYDFYSLFHILLTKIIKIRPCNLELERAEVDSILGGLNVSVANRQHNRILLHSFSLRLLKKTIANLRFGSSHSSLH